MAAQVEVQTGEVGRAVTAGRPYLSPLTDSSNTSIMEIPAINQPRRISPEPNKPVPGPKPRLTPKPFAVEKNPTIKPILAPKPQPKPRPESTRLPGHKPELPSGPKPQQPSGNSKPRPSSTNPNRPASTSFRTPSKLNSGQTTKPVVHPFKPAPPLEPLDLSKPPVPAGKPAAPGLVYSKSLKSRSAAEWAGTTKKENDNDQSGTSITRAKSMGFLVQVGQQEEDKDKDKAEATVAMRAQSRGSRPRPVSAIFLSNSPTKTEAPTPSPRWERRPLSADLTSKFESPGLSVHNKSPKASAKENTPESGAREPEKKPGLPPPSSADPIAKPAASEPPSNKKSEETSGKEAEEETRGASIKSRISLLLDASASSQAPTTSVHSPDLASPEQQAPGNEAPVGVKERIKQLTEDNTPNQSPAPKPALKPRPLPLDLTKRFTPERSPDLGSVSLSEATERHEASKDPPRRMEESVTTPSDPRTSVDFPEQQKASASETAEAGQAFRAAPGPSAEVQTVRASLFDNVVERHSVQMLDEGQPASWDQDSLSSPSFRRGGSGEGQGPPSSPFEGTRAAQPLDPPHMGIMEGNRPAGEPTTPVEQQGQPRYLRIGALPKWNDSGLDPDGMEEGMLRQSRRDQGAALREAEQEEAAGAPKRPKMLQEEQSKPRATYFALTGQLQEAASSVDDGTDMEEPMLDDLSARSAQGRSQEKALGQASGDLVQDARSYAEEMMEVEKKRELVKEAERQKNKVREMEREKQRQLETERQAQLEFERLRERDMQREFERQRQKAFEREKQEMEERQQALEVQRQLELEKQRLQEAERDKQRELERQQKMEREKQLEMEQQRKLERERQREMKRQKLESERQLELQRERQLEMERQKMERERQLEMDKQRELERDKQLIEMLEKQRLKDLERKKEAERKQLLEQQKQKQREEERQRVLELEKQRLREKMEREQAEKIRLMALEQETLRLRELEKERQREAEKEMERQRELDRHLEMERQKQLEMERQKQLEMERQKQLEMERQKHLEMERLKHLEMERLKQLETERLKQLETERQKQLEMERQKQLQKQLEMERQKQLERERQKQLEWERQKQLDIERQKQLDVERQKHLDMERQRRLDTEHQELEKQRLRQREAEKERLRQEELERRQLAESEKQKQAERERQQILEMQEKQRLRERERAEKEKEEAERMRLVARQQDAERQRIRDKQRREQQEASPLKPKVLDLDSLFRSDSFSKTPSPRGDPSTRWKEPPPRPDETYRPAILDIDSFSSQTQPPSARDPFAPDSGFSPRSQATPPERDVSWRVPAQTQPAAAAAAAAAVWSPFPQDPWELQSGEMSVDTPESEPRRASGRVSVEQLLRRQDERQQQQQQQQPPHKQWPADPFDSLDPFQMAPFAGSQPKSAGSSAGLSSSVPTEDIWLPREPQAPESQANVRSHRRSQGSQELNRMRSRSVSRRSAPSSSAVEASLSRMRSRSAHREQDRHSWVQQKQSTAGEEEEEEEEAAALKDSDTPLRDTDSQYGTWETGLRTDDSLTPATPSSDSNLSPSPKKPSPSQTPGERDADVLDGLLQQTPSADDRAAFPEAPAVLLDNSALRSKVQLGKKRGPRSRPSRMVRRSEGSAAAAAAVAAANEEWLYRDSTEPKAEPKSEDSDSDSAPAPRAADSGPALASQPQRVALFPGVDPSALKVQLKKRGESDSQTDGASPSQLSRSPKSPFLPRATRVLPPAGAKENGEEESPQWLKELKSKKRLSQYESET